MARVEIPVTDVVRSGVLKPTPTASDATNDHFINGNDGTLYLEIENQNASDQTVDLLPSPTYTADGLVVVPLTLTIPAGEVWEFGPFKVLTFRQNDGSIYLDPSISTDLLIIATRRPSA